MKTRPLAVTIIGWLFIVAGTIGFLYHVTDFSSRFEYNLLWVVFLRLLAIVCGVFILRGSNWARWLLLIWLFYHIILSAFHSWQGAIIHAWLFILVVYFLFRAQASSYFRRENPSVA